MPATGGVQPLAVSAVADTASQLDSIGSVINIGIALPCLFPVPTSIVASTQDARGSTLRVEFSSECTAPPTMTPGFPGLHNQDVLCHHKRSGNLPIPEHAAGPLNSKLKLLKTRHGQQSSEEFLSGSPYVADLPTGLQFSIKLRASTMPGQPSSYKLNAGQSPLTSLDKEHASIACIPPLFNKDKVDSDKHSASSSLLSIASKEEEDVTKASDHPWPPAVQNMNCLSSLTEGPQAQLGGTGLSPR